MVQINRAPGKYTDADLGNRRVDTVEEGGGGTNWEIRIDT